MYNKEKQSILSLEEFVSELCHPLPLAFDQGLALGPAIGGGSRGMYVAVVVECESRQRRILFLLPHHNAPAIESRTCKGFAIELDLVSDRLVCQEDQGHRSEGGVELTDGVEEATGLKGWLVFDTQVYQPRQDMLWMADLTGLDDPCIQRDTGVVVRDLIHSWKV